jgi:integrase/recombinase XerD
MLNKTKIPIKTTQQFDSLHFQESPYIGEKNAVTFDEARQIIRQDQEQLFAKISQQELKSQIAQLQQKLEDQEVQMGLLASTQRTNNEQKRTNNEQKKMRNDKKQLRRKTAKLPVPLAFAKAKVRRDAAATMELITAWKVVEQSKATPFLKARDKVVLLMLYITGERITNLLYLTVNHLNQVIDQNQNTLIIQRHITRKTKGETKCISTQTRKKITISNHVKRYAHLCREEIALLTNGKQEEDPVITPEGSKDPIGRVNLNKQINKILKETGKILNKKLSSHSFRIGLTISIIKTSGLNAAQAFIGHANIATTNVYNKYVLKKNQMLQVANKADRYRERSIGNKYRKKTDLV